MNKLNAIVANNFGTYTDFITVAVEEIYSALEQIEFNTKEFENKYVNVTVDGDGNFDIKFSYTPYQAGTFHFSVVMLLPPSEERFRHSDLAYEAYVKSWVEIHLYQIFEIPLLKEQQ